MKLLTCKELAGILHVSTKTLANWRYMGKIPFVKIGGRVRYRWEEIILWIDSQKVR